MGTSVKTIDNGESLKAFKQERDLIWILFKALI